MLAGSLLARGTPWVHGDLLSAHMALNLAGWFGVAIVGTLHTFYPSLTQTQLRYPRLQNVAFAAWTGGVAALAVGYGWAVDPLAFAAGSASASAHWPSSSTWLPACGAQRARSRSPRGSSGARSRFCWPRF